MLSSADETAALWPGRPTPARVKQEQLSWLFCRAFQEDLEVRGGHFPWLAFLVHSGSSGTLALPLGLAHSLSSPQVPTE